VANVKTFGHHPLSSHFTWKSPEPPFRYLSTEQVSSFAENGFCVAEGAFDAVTLAGVLSEIDPLERELEDWLRRNGGRVSIARAGEITFTTHLVARSSRIRDFVSRTPLTQICSDLIGPEVRLYWDQAVYKKPDTDATFPWHQDNGYAFVEPQQYLTCWIALTDATEDNGCPWVVPGIHRIGTLEHRQTETGLVCMEEVADAIPVPVPAGAMVIFSSLTPHCTGPNKTDDVRKAYIVQYAPDGARVVSRDEAGFITETPATAPERQFPVVVKGAAVGPAERRTGGPS